MWEDENCKDGGRWILRMPKTHTNKFWEDLVLAMLGESFTVENEINGLVISLKPNSDTIAIWNRNGKDEKKVQAIKEDLERILKIEEGMKLDYEVFADVINQPPKE